MDNDKNSKGTVSYGGNHCLNYNSLIEKVAENGDLLILGNKGTCKTTLLKHLARELRKDDKNRLIIIETFPKWIQEFDRIHYMIIGDDNVKEKENLPYMEQEKTYIQWSKDYVITNADNIRQFLKGNKDCLFLITCESMESITAVMSFVIYTIYRKQYQRAFYGRLNLIKENF